MKETCCKLGQFLPRRIMDLIVLIFKQGMEVVAKPTNDEHEEASAIFSFQFM